MKNTIRSGFLFAVVGLEIFFTLMLSGVHAQGINYQAVIRDNQQPLQNRQVVMRFTLQSGSIPVYQETHALTTDDFGGIHTQIGRGTPVLGSFSQVNWRGNVPLDLMVELDQGNGFAVINKQALQGVPYSFVAETVRQLPPLGLDALDNVSAASPGIGEVLTWDGTHWVPGIDKVATGGGAVNTSSRLAGDGSTDNPLDLAAQGAQTGQVLKWNGNNWVPANDERGDQVFVAGEGISFIDDLIVNTGDTDPTDDLLIGSQAGGDLEGFFPNPSVSRIQGNPVSAVPPATGQVLKWNGQAWQPSADEVGGGTSLTAGAGIALNNGVITNLGDQDDSDDLLTSTSFGGDVSGTYQQLQVKGLVGRPISGNVPQQGEVLTWDGTQWGPAANSMGSGSVWTQEDEEKISYLGKIGLNVANPIFDLQSAGTFIHDGFFQVASSGFPAFRIRHDATPGVLPKAIQQFTLSGSSNQGVIEYSPAGLDMKVLGPGLETSGISVRFDGKIGINDATPAEALDVAGGIKVGNTSTNNAGTIRYTGTDFEGRKGNEWVSLTQGSNGGGNSPWSSEDTDISFEGGNVGIGVNTPQELLHIHNPDPLFSSLSYTQYTNNYTTAANGRGLLVGVRTNNGITDGVMQINESGRLFFGTNSRTRMVIDAEGKMGLGTIRPDRLLHLEEDNSNTNFGQLLITQSGTGDAVMNLGISKEGHYALGVDNSDEDKFKIGFGDGQALGISNNNLLTLQSNGNLGLGTSSPSRKLTVSFNNNNSTTSQFLIEQRGGGDAFMNFSLQGGASYAMGIDNSDSDKFKIGYDNNAANGVGNSTLLEMDPNGNMEVTGEIRRSATGAANLVPLAMGKIRSNGQIVSEVSTNNFSVKVVNTGEFEITLDIDLPPANNTNEVGLVLATVSGALNVVNASVGGNSDAHKIFIKVYDLPENLFDVVPCQLCGDNYTVTFMFYRP